MTDSQAKPTNAARGRKRKSRSKGGRPVVDAEARRSVVVSSRYTPAEYESLVVKAARAGVTPSALQAAASNAKRVPQQQKSEPNFELVNQLRKIGNNLNQLTHLANATKRMPAGLERVYNQINRLTLELMGEGKK